MKLRRKTFATGQSLVEYALIAPLLIALMFVIIELGIIFSVYIGLTNGAREAARAGLAYQHPQPDPTNPTAVAVGTVDNARAAVMDAAWRSTLNAMIDPSAVTAVYTYQPSTPTTNVYRSGDKVTVTLTYTRNLFFGFLRNTPLPITASSEMRLEIN